MFYITIVVILGARAQINCHVRAGTEATDSEQQGAMLQGSSKDKQGPSKDHKQGPFGGNGRTSTCFGLNVGIWELLNSE